MEEKHIDLLKEILKEIKKTKKKFKKFIIYINENKEINNSLSQEIKLNLKELIKLWKNTNDNDLYYFFNMKVYHSHINRQFNTDFLNNMWDDYIISGLKFRTKILYLNSSIKKK